MSSTKEKTDSGKPHAAAWLATSFMAELIAHNDPDTFAKTLTQQLRELTGAQTVILLHHDESDNIPCRLLYACPPRRADLLTVDELTQLYQTPLPLPVHVCDIPVNHPLRNLLTKKSTQSILIIPLYASGRMNGKVILLDLPEPDRIDDIQPLSDFLSPFLGIALQNALIQQVLHAQKKNLEEQVKARTEDLNGARLAALNMMEDAVLAKDRLEITQYALDHSADAVFWVERDTSFSYVNNSACQLLGYTREELLNLSVPEIDPNFPPQKMAKAFTTLEQSGALDVESTLTAKDGRIIPVEIHDSIVRIGSRTFICAFVHDITSRKMAERALRESRTNLKITLNSIGDAVISTDTDGRVILMNPIAETLTGWPQAEAAGKPLEDIFRIINESTREIIRSPVDAVLKSGMIVGLANHTLLLSKNGREIPIADSGAPIKNEEGETIGVVLVFRDQTKERAARKEIEESEARYRLLFENMTTGFALHEMIYDDQGRPADYRWLQVNPAFEKLTGLSAEKAIGHTVKELLPETEDIWIETYGNVAKTGQSVEFESYAKELDKYFEVRAFCPAPDQFAVMFSDISDRKRSAEALARSEAKYRQLFEQSTDASLIIKDGCFIDCNQAAIEMLHCKDQSEINNRPPGELSPETQPDGQHSHEKAMQLIQRMQHEKSLRFEWHHQRTDGEVFPVEVSLTRLIDTEGNHIIHTLWRDISETKQLQKAIEKRIIALTRPLNQAANIAFNDLFDLTEFQRIQDEFAAATGVASIITRPDGTPITQPSNFTELCKNIIRKTKKGCENCYKSDAALGRCNPEGPVIQPCLSGGLWDAGVSITVGDQHIANWLIGQVRDETQTEENMRTYAREIGADETAFIEAFQAVPSMSHEHFEAVAQALYTLANQLSTSAYQNIQQARFIADQKKAEQALRESQEYLAAMWSTMDIGILLIDAATRKILRVNPAILTMSGYREAELIGKICHKLVCPAEVEKCPVGDLQKPVDRSERKLVCSDGKQIDVEKSVKKIFLNGKTVYLETLIDISERNRALAELRRLSTAIEQSPDAVVITEPNGIIQYVNPAFETITGYSPEEARGKTPRILKSSQHSAAFYTDLWKTISTGNTWTGHLINKHKNGELYTEEATITPVRNATGEITGYVAIKRDITQELAKEERFRQSQKMEAVGQLAGGIAHDFNNILQAILGFSEILLCELNQEGKERRHVVEIEKAAKRAAEMTRQLLAFSRKQPVDKKRININETIGDTEVLLQILLGKKATCTLDLAPDLNEVYADHSQITQIIMNLAVNARDAMTEEGRLTIATENITFESQATAGMPDATSGSFVCLSVTDTGCGMDQEAKDHLFEPFFTTKAVGKGTGLGLSVVYGIVKQNRGWIHVYSEENLGTTFKIYLPSCTPASPDHPGDNPHPGRILLVDDDKKTRDLVTDLLQTSGYEAIQAESAEEAIKLFRREKGLFDMLFSDIILPEQTGISLADTLRIENPTLPVLLYSGYQDRRERWIQLESKGYHFLQKPFSIATMLAAVHDTLSEKFH